METIISQIEQFLLKNAWGVIIGGIISSMLGALLCYLIKNIIRYLNKKYRILQKRQKSLSFKRGYHRGAAAAHSEESTYRQVLLAGDYILDVLFIGLKILVCFFVASIFIIMSNNLFLDMLIIFVCSFMIYPQYNKLKESRTGFDMTYYLVFGEDFFQQCEERAIESFEVNQEEQKQTSDEH